MSCARAKMRSIIVNYWLLTFLAVVLLRHCKSVCDEKERLVAQKEKAIFQLQSSVTQKEQIIARLQRSLSAASYTCHVSGPGQNVTAELQSVDQSSVVPTTVSMRSPSQYEVSYTVLSRGQHKLHVRLNGSEVSGSHFNITVYPDPTQLGTPVKVVTDRIEKTLGYCH